MKIILTSFGDFDVLAAVEDGREAVDYCLAHEVDVALLDVRMPNMNGVEAVRALTAETRVKPLILTTFDDDEYIGDAVKYGAKGYLLKNTDPERIREAIKSVYHGQSVLQDEVFDKIKSSLLPGAGVKPEKDGAGGSAAQPAAAAGSAAPSPERPAPAAAGEPPIDRSRFTERELSVMALVAKGLSNKEISKRLFISEGTTANYITSVLNKTGLEHRTQIAIYYLTGVTGAGGE